MNLLLLSIKGLRSFLYCEFISTVVILVINIYLCHLVLTIILKCTPCIIRIGVWNCVDVKRPIFNFLVKCLTRR